MIDLTKFDKKFEELETDEDRWLYILKNAGSSRSSIKFDNPAIEDALRRIECGTVSEDLLIRQANMTDYINVCRAAVAESFDDGFEKGEANGEAKERSRNEAANAVRDSQRAEFLRSHNVSDELISAMLAIK